MLYVWFCDKFLNLKHHLTFCKASKYYENLSMKHPQFAQQLDTNIRRIRLTQEQLAAFIAPSTHDQDHLIVDDIAASKYSCINISTIDNNSSNNPTNSSQNIQQDIMMTKNGM